MELETRYLELRERARALAGSLEPIANEADAASTLHPKVREALADSGLTRFTVPAAYGGAEQRVDPMAVCLIREALMGTCSHADSLLALQGIGSYALALAGSQEQRGHWLPRVASLQAIAALALTEPEAGSDLKAIQTKVRRDGPDLVLDGHKSFISNAGVADFYTVLAREGDGYSMFIVASDAPGVCVEPLPELIAPHIIADVRLRDVRLGEQSRIGDPGEGLRLALSTLATFRVSVAGAAVGLADSALREAARHAGTRRQFGRTLAELGPVAALLADSWADVEAARLLTYDVALAARPDPLALLDRSSMAKLAASEAASRVVDRCVQVMGRWGLVRGGRIEKLYRQSRPLRIYEGASEVLRLGIARRLVQEVA
ncbi:MAG TPA: acyl-CoA dehydrogenase family protein [Solirubrobacteraceae bacterium]